MNLTFLTTALFLTLCGKSIPLRLSIVCEICGSEAFVETGRSFPVKDHYTSSFCWIETLIFHFLNKILNGLPVFKCQHQVIREEQKAKMNFFSLAFIADATSVYTRYQGCSIMTKLSWLFFGQYWNLPKIYIKNQLWIIAEPDSILTCDQADKIIPQYYTCAQYSH